MNAAIALDDTRTPAVDKRRTDVQPAKNRLARGFGRWQLWSVGLSMLAVFGTVVAGMTWYNGEVVAAVGLGVYLAIWLGLGFGFLIGGVAWSLEQEARADH
ncbi:MAG: hypothetical protein ACR2QK_11250 [Acidimicrobiales bacterium]